MENWTAVTDESSGQTYYFNTVTNETSWDVPIEYLDLSAPAESVTETAVSQWEVVYDEASDSSYYYNATTGETSWEQPADYFDPAVYAGGGAQEGLEQAASADAFTADADYATVIERTSDWEIVFDEASGTSYYYNATTGETSWEQPADYVDNATTATGAATYTDENSAYYTEENVASINSTTAAAGEWEEVYDETSNSSYYYNATTGETSWENPNPANGSSDYYELDITTQAEDQYHGSPTSESKSPVMNMSLFDSTKLNLPVFPKTPTQDGKKGRHFRSYITAPDNLDIETASARSTTPTAEDDGEVLYTEDDERVRLAMNVFRQITPELQWNELADVLMLLEASWFDTLANITELSSLLSSSYRMEKYAETYFQYDRRGINNLTSMLDKLLSYQMDPLKSSLTLLSTNLHADALLCFRYILGFMSSKKSNSAASFLEMSGNLILKMLSAPSELHDEIYCQLCKQIRKNPSAESAELGCQLILICLVSFAPSKRLLPYFLSYCCSLVQNPSASEGSKKFIHTALKLCIKASLSTTRKELPTEKEIQALILGDQTEVVVQTIDGNPFKYYLDSFTTFKQLEGIVCANLGISDENRRLFSIFELDTETGVVSVINQGDRVLDVVSVRSSPADENNSGSNHTATTYNNNNNNATGLSSFLVTGNNSTFKGMTQNSSPNKMGASSATSWRVGTASDGQKPSPCCFLFKVSHYLPLNYFEDKMATQLFYTQATHDVVTAFYPHTLQDAIVLAAIQMQQQLGDHTPGRDLAVLRGRAILKYMYKDFVTDQTRTDIESKVMNTYKALAGMSSSDAQQFYISYVRGWKTYGATFFIVNGQGGVDSHRGEEMLTELVLAVTSKQLLLMDINTSIFVAEYNFDEILSWGHSFDSFVLVSGSKSSHVKSYFKTLQGKEIDDLLNVYQTHDTMDYDST